MLLPALYHWSPRSRREAIQREGLRPYAPALTTVWQPGTDEHIAVAWPWVCLGTDPARAWQLSGGMGTSAEDSWDLWQITLADGDEVHVQPEFGTAIKEIRVMSAIPACRVWFIAERAAACAVELT